MDEREKDLRDKLAELRALEKGGDASALFDWAARAALALEFRATDAMIGLSSVDDDLVAEVERGRVEALRLAGEKGHEEAAVAFVKAAWADRDDDLAEAAATLATKGAGNSECAYLLGLFAFNGFGVEEDKAASRSWHLKAAEKGHAGAMFELYAMFSQGLGGPKNDDVAHSWCRKSAEAGNIRAMSNLGSFYATGNGVPQDEAESLKWYDAAAKGGHGRAAATLGVMYALGQGAPHSTERATEYFAVADEHGFDWRDLAEASGLDPDELES